MGVAYMDTAHNTNQHLDRQMGLRLLDNHLRYMYPIHCLLCPGTTHISDHHDNDHMYYSQNNFQLFTGKKFN